MIRLFFLGVGIIFFKRRGAQRFTQRAQRGLEDGDFIFIGLGNNWR